MFDIIKKAKVCRFISQSNHANKLDPSCIVLLVFLCHLMSSFAPVIVTVTARRNLSFNVLVT